MSVDQKAPPKLSPCPRCNGYGIRDSGARCKMCGGCGELFDGLKFSVYQQRKQAESPASPETKKE